MVMVKVMVMENKIKKYRRIKMIKRKKIRKKIKILRMKFIIIYPITKKIILKNKCFRKVKVCLKVNLVYQIGFYLIKNILL